ncbi:MAG: M23 family metallopeptidase [Thermomicrobiales bacterium]|nr:M23 family metallopeptidase [Thermomicrobiales bacterium]MCA9881177.1 M23 family metallopeptidase [Thermomicrobiales bacterium]
MATPTRVLEGAEIDSSEVFSPVVASLIAPDTAPALGTDGQNWVVYELLLTNTISGEADITGDTVTDALSGHEVFSLSAEEMIAGENLRLMDREPAADAHLSRNESRVLLLAIPFAAADDVPLSLVHDLQITAPTVFGVAPEPQHYLAATLDLATRQAPVISPPLAGTSWIAAEGCCSTASHHRNGVSPINGALHAGQRFGFDFIRINDDGQLFTGDQADPSNWPAYDAPVFAAADGVVISTLDGLPDQIPAVMPDQSTMSLAEIEGNHVMIDHGDGFYTFYGHLAPGSVQVEVGDTVAAGEQLARVGDSGGSQAPHLHFHDVDSANPSAGNGFPFTFDRFDPAGQAAFAHLLEVIEGEAAFASRADLTPEPRENEMPMSYAIVDFPER